MWKINQLSLLFMLLFIVGFLTSCIEKNSKGDEFVPIAGFSDEVNNQLNDFFKNTKNETGRKIAVFDGDGTVLGQTPHYLADEAMYHYAAENPEKNKEIFNEMISQSNVSIPYVQNRIKFIAGETLQFYRDLGEKYFKKYYSNKIFKPMRDLINTLKKNDFEVWIVTASPEGMYQQFLSNALQIPITNIVGVKSTIRNGIITDEIVNPVPQDHGKKEAIETFIQDVPLFVAGNSRGDKEMIEHSKGLKMIVNPDEHIAPDQSESIADYAKNNNWLVARINDVPTADFPAVSSKKFGIRLNKTRKVE